MLGILPCTCLKMVLAVVGRAVETSPQGLLRSTALKSRIRKYLVQGPNPNNVLNLV